MIKWFSVWRGCRLVFLGLALLGLSALPVRAAAETLVASGAACRYLVPVNGAFDATWTARTFDDAAWSSGYSGLGYDDGDGNYLPYIDAPLLSKALTLYTRFNFCVTNLAQISSLTLQVLYEDGFVAYLNGLEVARGNVTGAVDYQKPADNNRDENAARIFENFDVSSGISSLISGTNVLAVHCLNSGSGSTDMLILPVLVTSPPGVVSNIVINEFLASNKSGLKNSLGESEKDWIELYNPNANSVSLSGWYLTDTADTLTKWKFPVGSASSIAGKGYLLVWADSKSYSVTNNELHASFALSKDGEYLALVKPDGTVFSAYEPAFPAQYDDISYGVGLTGENHYFTAPTPGQANSASYMDYLGAVADTKFSADRGFYSSPFSLTITSATGNSTIRYTLDGSTPTETYGTVYTNTSPILINKTTVVRALAYKDGYQPTDVDTQTYIFLSGVLTQPAAPTGFPSLWGGTAADYQMDPRIVNAAAYSNLITGALRALPALSIATHRDNLFSAATGIIANSGGTGIGWERPVSMEWIEPDGSRDFQIDAGIRVFGGYFRDLGVTRKKSFRLLFKGIYGATKLATDVFPDQDDAERYDSIVLRAGANDGYNNWGNTYVQYIIDEFVRRTHLAMGRPVAHGTFVHLYLDGLYWGLYNVAEQLDASFAATYFGGNKDDWDARSQDEQMDGNSAMWDAMLNLCRAGLTGDAAYRQLQGRNTDGTRNPAYPVLLDVPNYIDYMLLNLWINNADWPGNNWRAACDRTAAGTGFKFLEWDAEISMLSAWTSLNTDITGATGGAAEPYQYLRQNPEFRLLFADHVQRHMFNGGGLTATSTVARYTALANGIEQTIIAETARWGDQYGGSPYTLETWRAARNNMLSSYLPQRPGVFLTQLRNAGLFPVVDAPVFSRFGGLFTNSLNLAVTSANPVYYTTDGSDPRQYGTGAAAGTLYSGGVALTRTARVKARSRRTSGAVWSALTEAVFTLAEKPALRVTELMFHPRPPVSGLGDGADEFIELQNAGAATVGLAGLSFTQGVAFDFASSAVQTLAPGAYVLVVRDPAAFTNRYPAVPPQLIAGVFAFPSASLDDAGEKVELQDAAGRAVVSFTYNNSWLPAADGAGHSLVPAAGVAQADGELDYPGNWRASVYIGGSPGAAEPAAPAAPLVLNEILAHTDYASPPYDSNDGIELYNTSAQPVTLGPGWYLSDDPENPAKWAIPATNTLAAHGWRYFDEIHDFHAPLTNGFGLNKSAEQVLLSYLPGTGQDRVVDTVSFKGEENGVALVRYPDGAASWFYGVSTPGASNRLAGAGVVIAEVMYHPAPTAANPGNNENDEFVELYNPAAQPVTLMNLVDDVGAWRLAGGIGYLFPANTVLPAGGRLAVVSFDPASNSVRRAAFLAAYGLTNGQVRLFGPYSGQLNNKTDTVRLERPVNPDVVGEELSWHVVDQAAYYDATPWPPGADGTGASLARFYGRNGGDDPASWAARLPATPGRGPAKVAVTAPAADTGWLAPASVTVSATVDSAFIVGTVSQVVLAVDGVDAASFAAAPYTASVALEAREGVRRLTARLTDGEGAYTSPAVSVMVYTNVPEFTLVMDQKINLTVTNRIGLHAAAALQGGMTNAVRFVWSSPGGGPVVLENPTQADAAAFFMQPGQYELMLTMYYGQLATNHFFTVTVTDANTVNRVPYRESFEAYELGATLVGINGWHASLAEAAVIETNKAAAPPGGYPLAGTHARSLSFKGGVPNLFGQTEALTNVCLDMLLSCLPYTAAEKPPVPSNQHIAFYVNTNRHVMVWHGLAGGTNRWTELPDVAVATNTFMRLTLEADYARDGQGSFGFRIWINRAPVTNPASFFSTASTNRNYLGSISLTGTGQADDLVVDPYNTMLYRRITAAAGPHGQVVPAGGVLVPVGASTNIAVRPDPYYAVGSVTVDGQAAGPAADYAFTNVSEEHALSADFLARLTVSGVPEAWLNQLNPDWTNNFEAHAQEHSDGDGVPNGDEYVAGTDAADPQSVFLLTIGGGNGTAVLSFPTVPAGGFYGLGGLRRYALEQADDLAAGGWQGVAGLTNVVGAGQSVSYTNQTGGAARRFFRGRVWLEP